jgi:hypothetical protein
MATTPAGHDGPGKPLQIAVDGVPGTTEVTRHPRKAKVKLRVRQFQRLLRN